MDEADAVIAFMTIGIIAYALLNRRSRRPRSRISRATRYRIWRRDHGICQYCGDKIPSLTYAHIDHRRPVSRGGSNDEDNLVLACPECNLHKGGSTPREAGLRDSDSSGLWSLIDWLKGRR